MLSLSYFNRSHFDLQKSEVFTSGIHLFSEHHFDHTLLFYSYSTYIACLKYDPINNEVTDAWGMTEEDMAETFIDLPIDVHSR